MEYILGTLLILIFLAIAAKVGGVGPFLILLGFSILVIIALIIGGPLLVVGLTVCFILFKIFGSGSDNVILIGKSAKDAQKNAKGYDIDNHQPLSRSDINNRGL